MAVLDHHDMLSPIDDPMSAKSPTFGMDSSPFFEYNQISDAFNSSFHGYDLSSHLSQSPTEYTGLHIGMADLTYAPMDNASIYAPQRPYTPIDSITPSLTHLSPPPLSASELSGDGAHSSRRSSTGSPDSQRGGAALPPAHGRAPTAQSNSSARYNPVRSSTRSSKKRAAKADDSDDDDEDADFQPIASSTNPDKREEIRKQRIESEQRRRDELREGYRRLKDALPPSNQKSSKVSLLDRAVTHIRYMELTRQNLQNRCNAAELEMQRLRQVNEALMLGTAEQRAAAAAASAAVQAQVQSSY